MVKRKDHTQSEPPVGSYHTRCRDYGDVERADGDAALDAYALLYGKVQRKLFAEVSAGRSATSLKSAYLERHQIPARMFNGVRLSLEGKVSSVEEQQKQRVDGLCRQIARTERQIADATERGRWLQVHGKKRRLGNLRSSTQSNLHRHTDEEIGPGGYREWQTAVREVRQPWLRRNTRYSCRRRIGSNWKG